MISALDVKNELKQRLEVAGVWQSVDLRESQFLDLSPQVFVELVLHDAGVLGKVTDIANEVRLAHPDEEIDVVVRAHWQVRSVLYGGYAVGLSGGVRAAERFDVVISSGSETRNVIVDVTKPAVDLLASRLHATVPDPLTHRKVVAELVRGYVELQLAQGGTSYWDPIRFPQLDVGVSAVEYMIGHQLFKVGA